MYHISANLPFSRREKNIWGYKKLQVGAKKAVRGRPFLGIKIFVGVTTGNVTPHY